MAAQPVAFVTTVLAPAIGLAAFSFGVYIGLGKIIFENKRAVEEGLKELAEESEENVTESDVRSWGEEMYSAHLYSSLHKKFLYLMAIGAFGWIIANSYLLMVDSATEAHGVFTERSLLGVENYIAVQYISIVTWLIGLAIEMPLIFEFRHEIMKSYRRKKKEVKESVRKRSEAIQDDNEDIDEDSVGEKDK